MTTGKRRTLESIDNFIHTLAFELRTNAGLFMGYSQLSKEFGPVNNEQDEILDKVQKMSSRLMQQNKILLDLWQLEHETWLDSQRNLK